MNWRQRNKQRVFLAAVEVFETAHHATACGMSRKLNELAEFVDKGGKVGKGALFVTAARGSNHSWLDWAVDFLACLPKDPAEKAAIVAEYNGEWSRSARRKKTVRRFWRHVKDRGLEKEGEIIAQKLA
jgi:hypothetical protein